MNPNLVVWTSDWHVVSNDGEGAIAGSPTTPSRAQAVVAYINGTLDPLGCIDTGDIKDHYGATGTTDEHDNYISYVGSQLRWLTVNAGDTNALYPALPGNHDEFYDATDTPPGGNNDFAATFDTKFWGAPYHWTCDWPAARIRFIGFHVYVHHTGTGSPVDATGVFHVASGEMTWLGNELETLPPGWQAIVCSHSPVHYSHGQYVRYVDTTYQYSLDTGLTDLLAGYASDIVCHLSGHRHAVNSAYELDGVTYVNYSGVSYSLSNGRGLFTKIEHDPVARTLTFDVRYATSPYERYSGYTPVAFDLPAFNVARGRAGLTPSTSSAARILTGVGT